jgi:predicted enzyme related to lactoylglutathione lyase
VKALGGTHKEPFDIFGQGRMAVCYDPNGAEFDLWQPKKMHGFDADPRAHGAPTWFETLTSDTARAIGFYEKLFGWTSKTSPMPGGIEYTVFSHDGRDVGGLMAMPPGMEAAPHWGVYFTVSDIDAAVASATSLGGTVCVPIRDIPGVGKFAGLISPQGVMLYVLQYL